MICGGHYILGFMVSECCLRGLVNFSVFDCCLDWL